jgi:replication factor C subunit 3/5
MILYSEILSNAINSKNVPNLLLYGDPIIDKLKLIKELFAKYNITKEIVIKEKNIEITKTNIYYLFNLSSVTSKNYLDFVEILKNYVCLKDYYSQNSNKYIILNDFTNIKSTIQNVLRVLMEKYSNISTFIILTGKISNIISPLRSRCLMIRIPLIKNKEKRLILYKNMRIKQNNNYEKTFNFIYNFNNIEKIEECIKNKIIIEDYNTPYGKIINKILLLYGNSMNKNNLLTLKSYAYNIIRYDLSINLFYKNLLVVFLNKESMRDKTKIKLIKYFADSEYNYNNSYRSIIIIESLLIYCYNIYNLSPRYD